ncbi:hypothetical protein KZP23_21130 [Echinicola marina]|uniref:hypothetical protein n=1 Tax=Echinicola marina TaxID=2859768 RepID=UPI001CF6BDE7|nr:hypothetical protein [Echinicola marina]UCS93131.1 hypothetical protein KZP23_21130 [Echinicola marina]
MKGLPKNNVFKTPEGYFDRLADNILEKRQQETRQVYFTRWAAAAILVLGLGLSIFKLSTNSSEDLSNTYALDQEVELMIDQGEWYAEDILSLSDDPNAILDQIIEEEWGAYEVSEAELEHEIWTY